MRTLILKLLTLITMLSCIIGCGCLKKAQKGKEIESGISMISNSFILNSKQLDSLCIADTLAIDLNDWIISSYVDYETGVRSIKYVYHKHINTNFETTYIVVKQDTLYKITKRKIVE